MFAHAMPPRAHSAVTIPLGPRVAEARRQLGLTQAELAAAVGFHRTALSKIESGARDVGSLELAALARALRRPVDWFLSEPMDAPDLLRELRRRRRSIVRIARRHGGRSVRVFGSAARGDARANSDVDLLIEMEPGYSLFDQAAMIVELRELLGRDVDAVTPEGLRPRIRDRVLREAVPL